MFSKIRNTLGGKMQLIFIGGAPATPDILEMSRVWLSCAIVQGYGQTETTGPIFAQDPDDIIPASIGRPLAMAEAKLADIPEMNCYGREPNPKGEIMLRGPAVAMGYFKDPKQTAEAFEPDGWLHTGDVGTLLPSGHLIIVDRKKQIFKLAQVVLHLTLRANISLQRN